MGEEGGKDGRGREKRRGWSMEEKSRDVSGSVLYFSHSHGNGRGPPDPDRAFLKTADEVKKAKEREEVQA